MKKAAALVLAAIMVMTTGCGKDKDIGNNDNTAPTSAVSDQVVDTGDSPVTTPTVHVSPVENVTVTMSTEVKIDKVIPKTHNENTVSVPLSDFIQEGDRIQSFCFTIYSADDRNIGTYKTAYQVSVKQESTLEKNTGGLYQTADFDTPTNGRYGEIGWDVPEEVSADIDPSGNVIFGFWWADVNEVRVDNAVCTFTRSRDIPCDGDVEVPVNTTLTYGDDSNNSASVSLSDNLPDGAVPEFVKFNISAGGSLRKFNGEIAVGSGGDRAGSAVTAVTGENSVSLPWFVSEDAKNLSIKDGTLMLNYWWSGQQSVDVNSVEIKYSLSGANYGADLGPSDSAQPTDFRSPEEIVDAIKVGWNLGNTLDTYGTGISGLESETAWGNPKATQELILKVKNAGFNAVRIPVTWGEHMTGNTIQRDWMNRVQEVVDYAYNNGMFVILNMHHDDYLWFDITESDYEEDSEQLCQIWSQISERFKSYGDRLIFEGMNEARNIGSANEWSGGTTEERKLINKYMQDFVSTVRATGGNNVKRALIVTTYGASAEEISMDDLVMPRDSRLIFSVHYYAPWSFTSGHSHSFGESEIAELEAKFDVLKERFADKGYPVIIGEFGCIAAATDATRAEYYSSYISSAKARGIKCFVWDNGIMSGEDSYGLIDRKTNTWDQVVLDGIMKGAK